LKDSRKELACQAFLICAAQVEVDSERLHGQPRRQG